jgi:hypothetical protein
MKKHLALIIVTLILAPIINSCKKDSAPKDYTTSIKDKTWWGTLTYAGKATEYYSVYFNTDNSLIWSQLSGDYPGQWSLSGKELTMSFPILGSEIKADVSNDNKLMNFIDNNSAVVINSGELLPNPAIPLDNTTWKGTISIGGAPYALQISFLTGLKIEVKIGNVTYPNPYKRIAAGGAFTNNKGFFGVITAATEMKGSDTNPERSWTANKQ